MHCIAPPIFEDMQNIFVQNILKQKNGWFGLGLFHIKYIILLSTSYYTSFYQFSSHFNSTMTDPHPTHTFCSHGCFHVGCVKNTAIPQNCKTSGILHLVGDSYRLVYQELGQIKQHVYTNRTDQSKSRP